MKIAIASRGPGPEDQADPRFGRCEYFILYDTEAKSFQALRNDAAEASNGAGGRAVNLIKKAGAELVLAGEVGSKAMDALQAAGIGWRTGGAGTVRSLIEAYGAL